MNQDQELVDSRLKGTVDEISAILFRLCAEDEATLDVALDELDSRILAEIRLFFQILSDGGATLRIVDDDKEYLFPDEALRRGRERVERMDITEDENVEIDGLFYLLPASQRFELFPVDKTLGVVRGAIGEEAYARMIGIDGLVNREYIGNTVHARLRHRIIKEHEKILHTVYTLIDIKEE
jgi:hypothetical protein